MDNKEAIQKNPINLVDVVRAKDKHRLAEIERNTGEILVLKVSILCRIRQMYQEILDLLTLRGVTDLVQLIEHQNHRH